MKNYLWIAASCCLAVVLAAGCATPSSPTGGPPDKEGPEIIRTEPETGTTNFSGRSIILHFSEFVRRASLEQAIIIEPDIGIDFSLDWGRKSVELEFDRVIPDSTTLIVTIGTEFEDTNNNGMAEPRKIAVSTGPDIDEGKLFGRVRNAETGEGREGERILLYRQPIDLSQRANYVASTDTSGVFEFSYLSEGKYKAFWVNDINRNKMWDPERERAQPFGREFISLADGASDTLGTVFRTPVDTTRPSLQGVGLFSSQRLRMRFSENIQLTDSAAITVTDTAGAEWGGAYPLYIQPGERFVLFGHSRKPLSESESYSLRVSGIVDNFGNPLSEITQTFTGSSQEDTTQQRIIGRNNLSGYYPTDPIEITYAKPVEEPQIRDSLKIVEGNELAEKWPGIEIDRNKLIISPEKQWKDGLTYEVRVWDPMIEDYRRLQPEIWHGSQMGELDVSLSDSTLKNVRLQITNEESGISRDTLFAKQVEIERLPPLNYTVVAFQDLNNNGKWDFGEVEPYVPPEPYFIQQQVPVKSNMTAELSVIFE